MRKFQHSLIFVSTIILLSCTASVQRTKLFPSLKLRSYNNIIINLLNASGDISANTVNIGRINSAQMMDGEKQAVLALESMQFELMAIGFKFVLEENKADAIVEFSIGSIRYDPLADWIADQAFVKFKDVKTGQILAFYRAKVQFVTPTVNNIIKKLASEIRKDY